MSELQGRVLIVDDNEDDQLLLKRLLKGEARLSFAFTAAEALDRLSDEPFDLIITDQQMPRMSGDALIREIKSSPVHEDLPCILLSGITSNQRLVEILKEGNIYHYFDKNKAFLTKDGQTDFLLTVRNAIRSNHLSNEKKQLNHRLSSQVESLNEQYSLLKKLLVERNPSKIISSIVESLFNRIRSYGILGLIRDPGTNNLNIHLITRGNSDRAIFDHLVEFAISEYQQFTGNKIGQLSKKTTTKKTIDFLNFDYIDGLDFNQIPVLTAIVKQELMGIVYILTDQELNSEEQPIFKLWIDQLRDAITRISDDFMDSNERFDAILNAIVSGVIITDKNGAVIVSNHIAQEILEIKTFDDLDFYAVISKLGISSFKASQQLSYSSRLSDWIEINIQNSFYEVLLRNLLNYQGEFIGILTIIRDITGQKRTEKQRDEFMHIISHELRNPINNVGIIIDLLRKNIFGDLTKGQSEYLEIAHKSLIKSNDILDDILDIAKFEEGKIPISFRSVKIYELIWYSMRQHSATALSKKINIEFTSEDEKKELVIMADEKRISQVMNNLLSNAIKFTHEGGIIEISIHQSYLDQKTCVISIFNTGGHINDDDLLKVFDKFEQLDISQQRTLGGTGLGLSICKNIILGHDGQIWVENKENGSNFMFSLPITHTSVKSNAIYRQRFRKTIMIIGENQSDLFILKSMLLNLEYNVTIEISDIVKIKNSIKHKEVNLIIYVYDENSFNRILFQHLSSYQDISVVTISPTRPLIEVDFHLEPPIDPLLLSSSLSALIHRARRRRKQRLLIIDEDRGWSTRLAARLEEHGYLPFTVADVEEASQRADLLSPDLCLLNASRQAPSAALSPTLRGEGLWIEEGWADEVLFARIRGALHRGEAAAPLLALPGEAEVMRELRARRLAEQAVGLCLIDVIGLKEGARHAGFMWAHHALIHVSDLLHQLLNQRRGGWSFLGHQRDNDLVVLIEAASLEPFCAEFMERFERLEPLLSQGQGRALTLRITALRGEALSTKSPQRFAREALGLHLRNPGGLQIHHAEG